jgi:uncharacterized membrane protein
MIDPFLTFFQARSIPTSGINEAANSRESHMRSPWSKVVVEQSSPDDEETLNLARLTSKLRDEHVREAGWLQTAIDRATAIAGFPGFLIGFTVAIGAWMLVNVAAPSFNLKAPDPPPFQWLQGAIGIFAVYAVLLILSTQRRQDRLISQLERLLVEMAVVSDEKSSKIISLLEEERRDDPGLKDRQDLEAERLSEPLDHTSVLKAIQDD